MAKQEMILKAKAIGANGVVSAKYHRSTKAEVPVQYAQHRYEGKAVIVGKKSERGSERVCEDLNKKVKMLMEETLAKKQKVGIKTFLVLGVVTVTILIAVFKDYANTKMIFGAIVIAGFWAIGFYMYKNCCRRVFDGYVLEAEDSLVKSNNKENV